MTLADAMRALEPEIRMWDSRSEPGWIEWRAVIGGAVVHSGRVNREPFLTEACAGDAWQYAEQMARARLADGLGVMALAAAGEIPVHPQEII